MNDVTENNSLLKLLEKQHQLQVVLRNHIVIVLVQSLYVKSDVIKSPQNCLFVNYHSKDQLEKLHKISKQIYVFNHQQLWLYKKRQKHTWFHYLKTPIWQLFMPRELQSNQKTFNQLDVYAVKEFNLFFPFLYYYLFASCIIIMDF